MPAQRDPHRRPDRRRRPHRQYTAATSFRKHYWRFVEYARLRKLELHGGRLLKVLYALSRRQPDVRSGIVYSGAVQLGALGGQSERSVQRATPELEAYEILEVVRVNPCDGKCAAARKSGGACKGHGGKTLDERGRCVDAANGFVLKTGWLEELAEHRRRRRRPPAQQLAEEHQAPDVAGDVADQVAEQQRPGLWERGVQLNPGLARGPSP